MQMYCRYIRKTNTDPRPSNTYTYLRVSPFYLLIFLFFFFNLFLFFFFIRKSDFFFSLGRIFVHDRSSYDMRASYELLSLSLRTTPPAAHPRHLVASASAAVACTRASAHGDFVPFAVFIRRTSTGRVCRTGEDYNKYLKIYWNR